MLTGMVVAAVGMAAVGGMADTAITTGLVLALLVQSSGLVLPL